MHAELQIGTWRVMLGDEVPQLQCKSDETLGASPISFYLHVEDVDAAFQKAVAAGGSVTMPVPDMFWGDRVGDIKDLSGHSWMLASHMKEVTSEELAQGAAQMAGK